MSTSQLNEAIVFLEAVASIKYLSNSFGKENGRSPGSFTSSIATFLPLFLSVARTSASFLVFGVYVVGAILMTRVYFLWTHNRPVQWLICGVFAAGTTVAVVFAAIAIHQLNSKELPNAYHRRPTRNYRIPYDLSSSLLLAVLNESGCVNVEKGIYWPVLFLVTVFRVRTRIASDRNKIVVIRLLRDGGMFYCVVVLASIAFAMSSSLMEDYPKIALPALLSNYLLAIHSICASHLILSIHSLAADIGSDPTFLLSNIEFSRVVWRKGASANELIVGLEIVTLALVFLPSLLIWTHSQRNGMRSKLYQLCARHALACCTVTIHK
ncbi:hypothetical protein ACEPAI_4115 [Sanghuangporus weigelae]